MTSMFYQQGIPGTPGRNGTDGIDGINGTKGFKGVKVSKGFLKDNLNVQFIIVSDHYFGC